MATDYRLLQPILLNDFLKKLPLELRVVTITPWAYQTPTFDERNMVRKRLKVTGWCTRCQSLHHGETE